jgi:hypothetical protein
MLQLEPHRAHSSGYLGTHVEVRNQRPPAHVPDRMAELLVGRVREVTDHPGARGPSLLLTMDFGPRGTYEAQLEPGHEQVGDLQGKLLVASIADGAAIVVLARSHAQGPVLVSPLEDVEPGTVVA